MEQMEENLQRTASKKFKFSIPFFVYNNFTIKDELGCNHRQYLHNFRAPTYGVNEIASQGITQVSVAQFDLLDLPWLLAQNLGEFVRTAFTREVHMTNCHFLPMLQSTIVRLPLVYLRVDMDPDIITIWFNWTGSFIVTISTVVPFQWVYHFSRLPSGSFVQLPAHDRLNYCLKVTFFYLVALVGTILALVILGAAYHDQILKVWRSFFFINAAAEAFFLSRCLIFIRRMGGENQLQRHLWVRIIQLTFVQLHDYSSFFNFDYLGFEFLYIFICSYLCSNFNFL
jgi:hypothetical protein